MSLELISNSIDLARELSLDLELQPETPSEEQIGAAIHVMNQHLWSVKGDVPALFRAEEAYLDLPEMPQDIELLSHSSLMHSRIEQAVIKGKIDSFRWLGSTGVTAFGIQLYGVDVLAPRKMTSRNAFVPVEAVGAQFAA